MNAQQKTIFSKMVKTAKALPVADLKEQAKRLYSDFSEHAGLMFTVVLTALEEKTEQAYYLAFCNDLENA